MESVENKFSSDGILLKIKRAYRRPKSEISSFGFRRYALWVN